MASKVTIEEINAFYREQFQNGDGMEVVEEVREDYARLCLPVDERHLRPGGYISGPTQMAIADSAAYAAVFSRMGITPMAVTSSLNINFLRPCIGNTVIAEAHLKKIGKTLAVIEVSVRAKGAAKESSHAVITYALPLS